MHEDLYLQKRKPEKNSTTLLNLDSKPNQTFTTDIIWCKTISSGAAKLLRKV